MTRELLIIVLCALAIAASGCGSGGEAVTDCYSILRYKKLVQPSFDLFTMNVRAGTGTRVDVYVQMQYQHLRFLKTDAGYGAAFTMLFVIKSEDGDVLQSREVSRSVKVRTYEESVSLTADAFLQSFTLAPGTYRLECSSTDQNSQMRYMNRSELRVQNFAAGSVSASSMLLLLKPRTDEKGFVLRPLFPQTLWYARDSIGIFRELYNIRRGDSITAVLKYVKQSASSKEAPHSDMTMSPPYVMTIAPCPRSLDEVVYTDSVTYIAQNDNSVPFVRYYPIPPLGYSDVEMVLRISHSGTHVNSAGVMKLFRQKSVHADSDEIIEAMRFIARGDELDSLRVQEEAPRARAIEQFWAERGGEARRGEFEGRVEEADRLFTVCIEGSRTPMGITYIVCGPPEAVDCRSPYSETWYYTVETQTMAVPFRVDRRNEDTLYYELPPYSVNDQLWRTFVDRWRRR